MKLREKKVLDNRSRETTLTTANRIVLDVIAAMWLPAETKILEIDFDGCGNVPSASLDCCYALNTIYFWEKPINQFAAVHRALKAKGRFVVAFVEKEFGAALPWTVFDFRFYSVSEVRTFFETCGFGDIQVLHRTEHILNSKGEHIERPFIILYGQKF
ncbi:class I SAM-dependent methyltransferase [Pedobacter duraquae]|uniref:Methyltransferase family protein n=1 Tax=Pedobacter duraquae TaxID=425511 RepID=A0A4R6IE32_9SPHI|nr:hypothetical protein [Pedobacter duraquae]TDO20224.1 hypothetical protein CLV32_3984 [Pedobacter duraquae]